MHVFTAEALTLSPSAGVMSLLPGFQQVDRAEERSEEAALSAHHVGGTLRRRCAAVFVVLIRMMFIRRVDLT